MRAHFITINKEFQLKKEREQGWNRETTSLVWSARLPMPQRNQLLSWKGANTLSKDTMDILKWLQKSLSLASFATSRFGTTTVVRSSPSFLSSTGCTKSTVASWLLRQSALEGLLYLLLLMNSYLHHARWKHRERTANDYCEVNGLQWFFKVFTDVSSDETGMCSLKISQVSLKCDAGFHYTAVLIFLGLALSLISNLFRIFPLFWNPS